MKDFSDMSTWSPKRLRTLRNNLNNRISAFSAGSPKELQKSHALFGLEEVECKELLEKVKKLLVSAK
ncbi:hypothetical protein [Bacteriovorax sp. Seq25_V]|uniref:hypothetical protein n=1 Tax=Bacteriovorax sp. Seq25_V TaxID=1201288 RepID=UPI000389F083|nr:hypothetical protein [Bacteriovorax sp. Seq25_V]EQC44269.1 hypothetical protein M900_A0413 [Bacteriovorax sp. Seq25_V]